MPGLSCSSETYRAPCLLHSSVSHPFLEKLLPALARQGLITDELVASLLSTTQATVASRANSSGLSASDLEAAFSGVLDGQTGPGTIRNALVAMIEIPALQAAGSRSLIVVGIPSLVGGPLTRLMWTWIDDPVRLSLPQQERGTSRLYARYAKQSSMREEEQCSM